MPTSTHPPSRRRYIPLLLSIPLAAMIVTLVACLPVPLSDPEKSTLNDKLTGVWIERGEDGKPADDNVLFVIPFDKRAHVVRVTKFKLDEDGEPVTSENGVYKLWTTRVGEKDFLVLEQLVPPQLREKKDVDSRIYLTAKYELSDDGSTASIWGVNGGDFEPLKDVKTTAAARRVIEKHIDRADLFLEKDTYVRVTDKARLAQLAKLFD